MNSPRHNLSRRRFLQGTGVTLALPFLESVSPLRAASDQANAPRRLLAVCNNLGVLSDGFFPIDAGKDYQLSPYLEELAAHRRDFTVLSGVSHPGVGWRRIRRVNLLVSCL